ncbi:MAG TPA: DUF448 domain-containing protein, partial [Rhizobiales bacterium]|nr:DUF448 domain-containing protein [Hyphomicrobiales bacterium]
DLLRFALSPDNILVPDIDAKAPGRGVWITDNYADVALGVKMNVFAKSLKQKIQVPSDLAQITQTRLEQRLKGALGLARKAGQLQTGATRVKSAIAGGTVIALLTATDAATDGRRKMLASLRAARFADHGFTDADDEGIVPFREIPHFDVLTSIQLGLALGQENVIHAALTKGAAAKSALLRVRKLTKYMVVNDKAGIEQAERNETNDK